MRARIEGRRGSGQPATPTPVRDLPATPAPVRVLAATPAPVRVLPATPTPVRVLAILLALLLTTVWLITSPAVAQTTGPPDARDLDAVCPAPADAQPGDAQPPSFPDLGTTHAEAITCAAGYGIVSGYPDGTFRPGEPINRGQMATFVAAWIRTATGVALPVPDEHPFTDVEGNVHEDAIAALTRAGIVAGRGDDTFAPTAQLTRGQFTSAIANAISYADVFAVGGPLPPDDEDITFTDTAGTTFERPIRSLAGVGIVAGTADGSFRPTDPTTRGQLATFLLRSADYLDSHQRWRPTARTSVVLTAELVPIPGTMADDDDPGGTSDGDAGGQVHPPVRGAATLVVNAFNGTLAYTLDLSNVPGPFERGSGATVHLGDPSVGGPAVLQLAEGTELDGGTGGVVTGVVLEADSRVRFADLLASPERAYVQVATTAVPGGGLRGTLRGSAN